MIISKSTCGICKPDKKWKRNNTKIKGILARAIFDEDLSISLIKSYEKKFKLS
ncbi:MAG: hypothetical protein Q8P92_05760 [Candidatus Daviesbacteria bacterium]|nr:hypothetical protein [Candidatus Daviesbacteria bacterium]